jgi:hypothetical protein
MKESGSLRCGAKLRGKDQRCRKYPLRGRDRCRLHGGKSLAGLAHPRPTAGGRYSKYLPSALLERYRGAMADPDALSLRDELALLDARITVLMERCRDGDRADQDKGWRQIFKLWMQRLRLVESEHKRMIDAQQMMTYEQGVLLVEAITESVRRNVRDRATLAAIADDFAKITGRTDLQERAGPHP